ncbi:site-specific DNA-methyltransferase [Arthrobacter sp. zg-Y769]|uniref:site-specific DNA-methyltransferase n=1 Tax=Arthrobacter sp. zg-Y769 TaxID=2894191 RepID=UPI001E638ABD|nr:site-specific DNA-methyltransferase [Arthrobacter sp. zg-Y769]MCC9205164.1 site-specific DNA-methyltransferase [Arthrobacter sp. zg-Y769]
MTDDVHEIPSTTPNFQTALAEQLADLVPEAIADGKVDVEKLKELLDVDAADGNERFGLFWPGKKRALRAAQEPTTATLRPDFENSKDWDTTKNVFIEGDNLEVLKILQKHYHAKIKMIYIDPPYNTGKDFVYPDNFKEGLDTYLEWTRQVNDEGKKLSSNAETEGRYHSNWLNMMYPRLKLARNLLTDDGLFFISISDHEQAHLRKLLDEVFGESNFIGDIIWNSTKSVTNTALISVSHTYNFVYAKNIRHFTENRSDFRLPDSEKGFSNPDNDQRGPWKADPFQVGGWRPNQQYEIVNPNTGVRYTPNPGSSWKNERNKFDELMADGRIVFGATGKGGPMRKRFLVEALERGKVTKTLWDDVPTTTNATQALKDLFGGRSPFDTPKPVDLIVRMLQLGTRSDSIVLDFFAGSGTTAHGVMQLNAEDGGTRRYIQVQLPEPVTDDSEAASQGLKTVAEIARKRIDLAGQRLKAEHSQRVDVANDLDVGYRSFVLNDTNFSKWRLSSDVEPGAFEQRLLDLRESSSADGASADDLLTELLLKQGYSLTEQVNPVEIAGLELRSVAGGLVLAYLDEHVKPSLEQLRAVVEADPQRLIVLEDAFQGDDELKTNLAQLCKGRGVELWTA